MLVNIKRKLLYCDKMRYTLLLFVCAGESLEESKTLLWRTLTSQSFSELVYTYLHIVLRAICHLSRYNYNQKHSL